MPTATYPLKTSSNHPQCANNIVLSPADDNHLLFSYFRNKVFCYNIFTKAVVPQFSVELTFYPICLTVNYGLVVAGGETGELAIFSLRDKTYTALPSSPPLSSSSSSDLVDDHFQGRASGERRHEQQH